MEVLDLMNLFFGDDFGNDVLKDYSSQEDIITFIDSAGEQKKTSC